MKVFRRVEGNEWSEVGEIKRGVGRGGKEEYWCGMYDGGKGLCDLGLGVVRSRGGWMRSGGGCWLKLGEVRV